MLVTREKMQPYAHSAVSTITKQASGLPNALIVLQTHSLQLAASLNSHVNVALGTREKMEPHVHNAVSTSTKQAWGLPSALIVLQTQSL